MGKGIFTVAEDVDDLVFQGSSTGQTSFNDALGPFLLGFFQVFLKLFGQSAGGRAFPFYGLTSGILVLKGMLGYNPPTLGTFAGIPDAVEVRERHAKLGHLLLNSRNIVQFLLSSGILFNPGVQLLLMNVLEAIKHLLKLVHTDIFE